MGIGCGGKRRMIELTRFNHSKRTFHHLLELVNMVSAVETDDSEYESFVWLLW